MVESRYYDWNATLAYDAELTMVVGARGIGKTYGIREQCVRDYLKRGWRFCEIVRIAAELDDPDGILPGYFEAVAEAFPDHLFQIKGKRAFIARRPDDEDEPPKWELLGYFVAMTQHQRIKKRTFRNVKRFIFDEFIIERKRARAVNDYINGEVDILASIVDSVSRERPDDPPDKPKPRVYLLANAGDLVNPWFSRYRITRELEPGYYRLEAGHALLHIADAGAYGEAKRERTVASHISGDSEYARMANEARFYTLDDRLFAKRPKTARFQFGIVSNGERFGVWIDDRAGYYYVDSQIPRGELSEPVFALTKDDASPNYIQATRAQRTLRGFAELYYYDAIRYESQAKRESFIRAMNLYGIR